jgi:hypothetical protein
MQDNDGYPLRIPALLHIDAVAVTHVDHALIEGIDRRVKIFDCALLA